MSTSLIRSILKNNRFLKNLDVKPVASSDTPEIALIKKILGAHGSAAKVEEQRVEAAEEFIEAVQPESKSEPEDEKQPEQKIIEVEKVIEVTDSRPAVSYRFDIERDENNLITSVVATPIDGKAKKKSRTLSDAVDAAIGGEE